MQLTDESRIFITGIPEIDSESDTQAFLWATLIFLILVGFLAPVTALVSGVTGPASAIFVMIGMVIYGIIIILRRWLFAGLTAATIVLASFNMGIPISEFIGNMRLEVMPVDVFLIPLGFLAILDQVDRQIGRTVVLFSWLSMLFAIWATFSGIVHTLAGSPTSSFYFGINQFRYPLMVFVSIFAVRRFSLRGVLVVALMALSLQTGYGVVQSLLGHSLGLSYYGEAGRLPRGVMESYLIGPLTFNTGLYPGGFFGSSRALLGALFLLFPLAIYWLFEDLSHISAWVIALGTPMLVAISRSDTGLILLLLATIGVLLIKKHKTIICSHLTFRQAIFLTVLLGGFAIAMVVVVLNARTFPNSTIRVQQYVLAIDYFVTHPLFGIGGQNFSLITEPGPLSHLKGIHNTFLAYLAELGLIGFSIYVVAVGIAFAVPLSEYIRGTHEPVMYGSLALGMLAFHAYSSLTLIYNRTPVMLFFWLVAGATVAGGSRSDWDLE